MNLNFATLVFNTSYIRSISIDKIKGYVSKIWSSEFWSSKGGLQIIKIVGTIATAVALTFTGISEGWFENDQAQKKLMLESQLADAQAKRLAAKQDNEIRLELQYWGVPHMQIDNLQMNSAPIVSPPDLPWVRLIRWSKRDTNADDEYRNYNKVEILYEVAPDPRDKLINRFKNIHLEKRMPFLQEFLQQLKESRLMFIHDAMRPETFDSTRYNVEYRDWFYPKFEHRVHIISYIGTTTDLKEHWYFAAAMDTAAYKNEIRRDELLAKIYITTNNITTLMRLEN